MTKLFAAAPLGVFLSIFTFTFTFTFTPSSGLAKSQKIELSDRAYRFDDGRITREALEPLLALREEGTLLSDSVTNDPLDELWLKRRDLSFEQWATWGPPLLARARALQVQLDQTIAHIRDLEPPTLLMPVKAFVLTTLRFTRDKREAGLVLLERWDLSILRHKVGSVDPAVSCADAIAKVEQLGDKMGRFNAFMYDWGNCVNRGRPDRYPTKAWRKFLKKYKVREVAQVEYAD